MVGINQELTFSGRSFRFVNPYRQKDRKTDRVRRVKRKVGKGLEVIQSTASRNKYISGREGILDVNFQGP